MKRDQVQIGKTYWVKVSGHTANEIDNWLKRLANTKPLSGREIVNLQNFFFYLKTVLRELER